MPSSNEVMVSQIRSRLRKIAQTVDAISDTLNLADIPSGTMPRLYAGLYSAEKSVLVALEEVEFWVKAPRGGDEKSKPRGE